MTTSNKRALAAIIGFALALLGLTLSGLGLSSAQAVGSSCPSGPLNGSVALSGPRSAESMAVPGPASGASGGGEPVVAAPSSAPSSGSSGALGAIPSPSTGLEPLITAAVSGGTATDDGSGAQLRATGSVASPTAPNGPSSLVSLGTPVVAPLAGAIGRGHPASAGGSGPLVNVSAPVHSSPAGPTGTLVNVSAPVDSPPAE